MIIEEKYIRLKNGRNALLCSPRPDDAETLIDFLKKTSAETDFLLRGTEDNVMSIDDERIYIEKNRESEDQLMICCFVDDNGEYRFAGNCGLSFNLHRKIAHRAKIGIAVLKEFWSNGIGTALMNEAEHAARERGVLQLELEFIESNTRARALYEKCGYRTVGVHPDAFRMLDGSFKNEYLMIKKL